MINTEVFHEFLRQHQLPSYYYDEMTNYFLPLAEKLIALKKIDQPLVVGINGAQGTGKSTLAAALTALLSTEYRCATLSIDDIYLTKAKREQLANTIHPLLRTRGVPGTHDVELGINTIQSLKNLSSGETMQIVRFDKSTDDRKPEHLWDAIDGAVDFIFFEGWCVGTRPQEMEDLQTPVNELEKIEDSEGIWRDYINRQLKDVYPRLFSLIDFLIFLKAPSFDCILEWRFKQEQKLTKNAGTTGMSKDEIARFIQHYQRLTEYNLKKLPELAAVVFELDNNHKIARQQNTDKF